MVGRLGKEVFAVANDGVTSITAVTIDAGIVRQTTADEAVREHSVVVRALTPAYHMVAVCGRAERQMSRPAATSRCR